jgi:hypothetical protein
MDDREMARWLAVARVVIGLAALVAPSTVLRFVVGADAARRPAAKYLGRIVAGRDIVVGAATFTAYREEKQLGRWCRYGMVIDSVDALSTLAAYRFLPRRRRLVALLASAGSAAGSGYLSSRIGD